MFSAASTNIIRITKDIIKVKSLCLTKHHAMKTYWGSGGIAFLTSVGGVWSASRPARLSAGERALTHTGKEAG
jgi:hypothetical protein